MADEKKCKTLQKSSYTRLFDDGCNEELAKEMGDFVKCFHSQTIVQGTSLEHFINSFIKNETEFPFVFHKKAYYKELENLDNIFNNSDNMFISKFFLPKKYFDNYEIHCGNKTGVEIDYIVKKNDEINIVEMKAGKDFDTKKSAGEIKSLLNVKLILTNMGYKVNNPVFVSYEAQNVGDIILKTDLKECQKMTMVDFLNIFLPEALVEKGKKYLEDEFQNLAKKNKLDFIVKMKSMLDKFEEMKIE